MNPFDDKTPADLLALLPSLSDPELDALSDVFHHKYVRYREGIFQACHGRMNTTVMRRVYPRTRVFFETTAAAKLTRMIEGDGD